MARHGLDHAAARLLRLHTRRFDMRQTRAFLRGLGISASDAVTWQTFADNPDAAARRRLAQTIVGTLDDVIDRLVDLQDSGAGAFLTINETTGDRRRAEDVIRVRALYVDIEDMEPREWHLEPSMTVRTGKGRHAYWTLADDMPLDDFRDAQKRLAKHYRADPAVHDLPRVMRLPGSLHLKGDPVPVTIKTINGLRYQYTSVLAGVPELPPVPVAMPRPSAAAIARAAARPGGTRAKIDIHTLDIVSLFRDMGMLRDTDSGTGQAVICPWSAEHSSDSSLTATMVWNGNGGMLPGFKCLHAHCDARGLGDVMRMYHRDLNGYAQIIRVPSDAAIEHAGIFGECPDET